MHATLYLMRSEMGSQCSFFRRGVEGGWRGAMRMSLAAKFWTFWKGWMRIGCTHEETVTVIKPREDVGGNKSFGCIFSEKSADWTNVFELEISGLTDFYDVFRHGQLWVENESKVPSRIRERDVVTTESNWVREGNGGRLWVGWQSSVTWHLSWLTLSHDPKSTDKVVSL